MLLDPDPNSTDPDPGQDRIQMNMDPCGAAPDPTTLVWGSGTFLERRVLMTLDLPVLG